VEAERVNTDGERTRSARAVEGPRLHERGSGEIGMDNGLSGASLVERRSGSARCRGGGRVGWLNGTECGSQRSEGVLVLCDDAGDGDGRWTQPCAEAAGGTTS
jgi:hypothetical protein